MASIKPTTIPSKRLAASINATALTFQLNNILGWDGNALTSADFGTVAYCVFRNSANTQMELMSFDPTTTASASITILLRGLKFTGDLTTEVTANKLTWVESDTIVELGSDVPQLLAHYVDDLSAQSIAGVKTFSSSPVVPQTPTQATEVASKGYVDLVAGGSALYDQNIVAGVAGEALTSGKIVYFLASDGKWYTADSATASKSVGVQLGIAQSSVSGGAAINVLIGGLDKKQTGLTAGSAYYLSTSGAISTTKGANIRFIGRVPNGSTTTLVTNLSDGNPEVATIDNSRTYVLTTGSANAYVMTLAPVVSAYKDGQVLYGKANFANTGAATVNVNGLGAIAIKKVDGITALDSGDIAINSNFQIQYNSTTGFFSLLSPVSNAPTAASTLVNYPQTSLLAAETITAGNHVCAAYYQADGGIQFDAKAGATNTASSVSVGFSVAANSNRILVVAFATATQAVNSITYGGAGMTKVAGASGGTLSIWTLTAPTSGSNTLIATFAGSTVYAYEIYSYYNAKQSGQPDNSSVAASISTTTLTGSITPVLAGCLIFSAATWTNGAGSQPTSFTGVNANSAIQGVSGSSGGTVTSGDMGIAINPVAITVVHTESGGSNMNGDRIGLISIAPFTAPSFGYVMKASAANSTSYTQITTTNFKSIAYLGVALNSAAATAAVAVQHAGSVSNQSGLTPVVQYFLADTAGTIATSAGTNSRKVGIGISATQLNINNNW